MAPPGQKYFIAVVPPSPLFEEIQTLKEAIGVTYHTKAALRSPPHITLHMPFIWPEGKEERLLQSLDGFCLNQQRLKIALNGYGCFRPRVVYITVEDNSTLTGLQHELYRHCKLDLNVFNANYQNRPFHPHITLAFRDLKKDQFEALWSDVKEKSFQSTFEATALTLLRHDGRQWNRYRDFALR